MLYNGENLDEIYVSNLKYTEHNPIDDFFKWCNNLRKNKWNYEKGVCDKNFYGGIFNNMKKKELKTCIKFSRPKKK